MQQYYAISAARDGFRRAGRAWQRKAEIVAASDLSPVQLEMLRADPNITVTPCAPDGAGTPAGGAVDAAPSADDLLVAMSVEDLRGRLIRNACRGLDPEEDFTSGGVPEVSALKRLTGLASISADERDQAWADHQKNGPAKPAA